MSQENKKDIKRNKSLIANYKKWSETRHAYLDFILDESDVGKWWVRIRDLSGEFIGGEYIIHMMAPKDYPFGPPIFYFKTSTGVFEVDKKVCISIGEYHKAEFAAAQGGMGGFARELLNGIICWKDMGDGISILHPEYHRGSPQQRAQLMPKITACHVDYAAKSRSANEMRFPELVMQFDALPLNITYGLVDGFPHSEKVRAMIKHYITPI